MSSNDDLAITLHATAIHLLRAARADDPDTGLSPARLSALSVVVHAGPLTLSELARQEQVSRPAVSQLVRGLEQSGLVRRRNDPQDGRSAVLKATVKGRRCLQAARAKRVKRIGAMLERMTPAERRALEKGLAGLVRGIRAPA